MTSLSRFLLFLSASMTSMIAFELDSVKRLTVEQWAPPSPVGMVVSVTSGLTAVSVLAFGVLADRVRPVALLFPLGPALPSLEIPLAMTAMFAHAAGLMIASIALLSLPQELTPDHLLGRMIGVVQAVVALSSMAGIYAGNHLADILDTTVVLWIFGTGMLLSIVPLHLVRYRERAVTR